MANGDQVQRRFYNYVSDHCESVKWINKERENEWLEKGLFELGLDPYISRAMILCGVRSRSAQLQSEIEPLLDSFLRELAGRSRKLHRNEFRVATRVVIERSANILTRAEAEALVKQAMQRNELRPRRSGLLLSRRWYRVAGRRYV